MPAPPGPAADPPDPAADLLLAKQWLRDPIAHEHAMGQRLLIVGRIARVLNHRWGNALNSHDVDDLTNDVTTLALAKMPEFGGRGSLDSWLCSLCRFSMLNRIRTMRRRQRTEMAAGDGIEHLPQPETAEELPDAAAALAKMGGYEADIIRLRQLDNWEFPVIAKWLGLSVANVKSRFYRGMRRLQSLVPRMQ